MPAGKSQVREWFTIDTLRPWGLSVSISVLFDPLAGTHFLGASEVRVVALSDRAREILRENEDARAHLRDRVGTGRSPLSSHSSSQSSSLSSLPSSEAAPRESSSWDLSARPSPLSRLSRVATRGRNADHPMLADPFHALGAPLSGPADTKTTPFCVTWLARRSVDDARDALAHLEDGGRFRRTDPLDVAAAHRCVVPKLVASLSDGARVWNARGGEARRSRRGGEGGGAAPAAPRRYGGAWRRSEASLWIADLRKGAAVDDAATLERVRAVLRAERREVESAARRGGVAIAAGPDDAPPKPPAEADPRGEPGPSRHDVRRKRQHRGQQNKQRRKQQREQQAEGWGPSAWDAAEAAHSFAQRTPLVDAMSFAAMDTSDDAIPRRFAAAAAVFGRNLHRAGPGGDPEEWWDRSRGGTFGAAGSVDVCAGRALDADDIHLLWHPLHSEDVLAESEVRVRRNHVSDTSPAGRTRPALADVVSEFREDRAAEAEIIRARRTRDWRHFLGAAKGDLELRKRRVRLVAASLTAGIEPRILRDHGQDSWSHGPFFAEGQGAVTYEQRLADDVEQALEPLCPDQS